MFCNTFVNLSLRSANINSMVAAYDGLKSTVSVMVHMTEGLPWPLKAVPQTFLYVLQLFEVLFSRGCALD